VTVSAIGLPPPATLSPRTVAHCRAILHKAIEDARRDETAGLHRNVVDLVDPPGKRQGKSRQKAKPTLSPEQVSALLIAMSQDRLWCYCFIAFAPGSCLMLGGRARTLSRPSPESEPSQDSCT
jgi:hypothetical protein